MRSVQVTRLDGPAGVEVVEAEEPAPAAGRLLVEVHALGVSFPDLLLSRGQYQLKPELPFQLGVDIPGEERRVGAAIAEGDRVP
jgi:NADPH2:quinone reductase